jgi:NADH-quinone oxidoreductase subunit M
VIALFAAFTLIIGAAYTLWLVKRIIYGEVANERVATMQDLDVREWIVLGAFAIAVLAIGIYPKPLTDLMEPAVLQIVQQLGLAKV